MRQIMTVTDLILRQVLVEVTASQCLPRTGGEEENEGVLGDNFPFSTCTTTELFFSKQPAGSQLLKMQGFLFCDCNNSCFLDGDSIGTFHASVFLLLLLVLFIFIPNKSGKNNVLVLLGVALLPFVDERRLRAALEEVYPDLTPEESKNYGILL